MPRKIKMILVGGVGAGKSSFANAVDNTTFYASGPSKTSEINFFTFVAKDLSHVQIWDIPGRIDSDFMFKSYVKDVDVIAIFLDSTQQNALKVLQAWYQKLSETPGVTANIPVVIYISKWDLSDQRDDFFKQQDFYKALQSVLAKTFHTAPIIFMCSTQSNFCYEAKDSGTYAVHENGLESSLGRVLMISEDDLTEDDLTDDDVIDGAVQAATLLQHKQKDASDDIFRSQCSIETDAIQGGACFNMTEPDKSLTTSRIVRTYISFWGGWQKAVRLSHKTPKECVDQLSMWAKENRGGASSKTLRYLNSK